MPCRRRMPLPYREKGIMPSYFSLFPIFAVTASTSHDESTADYGIVASRSQSDPFHREEMSYCQYCYCHKKNCYTVLLLSARRTVILSVLLLSHEEQLHCLAAVSVKNCHTVSIVIVTRRTIAMSCCCHREEMLYCQYCYCHTKNYCTVLLLSPRRSVIQSGFFFLLSPGRPIIITA